MNGKKRSSGKLNCVRLSDDFWGKYTRLVTKEIIPYQWKVLNDNELSHCIENFKIAAGEARGEFQGEVFQDTDVAKWLESVAYSLSYEENPQLEAQADEVIELIGRAQQEDGYLDTYFILKAPESKFKNLQQGHELYTAGHMLEAAVAYYQVTGKDRFLKIMQKEADLICDVFHTPEYEHAIPGHEEIEIGLIRLYEATGEKKYLDMAKDFIDRRGYEPNYFEQERKDPRWIEIHRDMLPEDREYAQCQAPVREQTEAAGHAVRAVYLYCAMADIASEYDDVELLEACERLYNNMVQKRMYVTGGIGSSGFLERFTADYDLPNASNYAESCASVGLALFCRRMAQITGDGKYTDTMELALMNTVLSGIAMDGKSFFYVNPLEVWPDNCLEYTSMAHVKAVRQEWFPCACCPPNIARTLASMGEYMYFTDNRSLWLNLYITGVIQEQMAQTSVKIEVNSKLPFYGQVRIDVAAQTAVLAELVLRCPDYAKGSVLKVDGKMMDIQPENGYWHLSGLWEKNMIEISFDMPAHFVYANPNVRADNGKVAVKKGPLVYCLEETDNGRNLSEIFVDPQSELTEEYREDILGGTMVLHARGKRIDDSSWEEDALYSEHPVQYKPTELTLIPYCYWGNRQPGEMQVWIKHS